MILKKQIEIIKTYYRPSLQKCGGGFFLRFNWSLLDVIIAHCSQLFSLNLCQFLSGTSQFLSKNLVNSFFISIFAPKYATTITIIYLLTKNKTNSFKTKQRKTPVPSLALPLRMEGKNRSAEGHRQLKTIN